MNLQALANLFLKAAPPMPAMGRHGFRTFSDAYRSQRAPLAQDLIEAWNDVAFYCSTLNANGVARGCLRLYVRTKPGQRPPRTPTKALSFVQRKAMGTDEDVREVTAHPALDLINRPAVDSTGISRLPRYTLFALTQLYLETTGRAFWHLEKGKLGSPANVWLLPSHLVEPVRDQGSPNIVDYFRYAGGAVPRDYRPEEIVSFYSADLADPYTGSRSPLSACWQRFSVVSKELSHAQATLDNQAMPSAVISAGTPDMPMGEDSAKRLEADFQRRFGRGGAGGIWVSHDHLKFDPVQWSPDLVSKIANSEFSIKQCTRCFGVPLAMVDKDANRANADAAREQHAKDALWPRMQLLADALTATLLPHYDDTGRLFFEFDSPVKDDRAALIGEWDKLLKAGALTINEVREMDGLPPVDWGNEPWIPQTLRQPSEERPRPPAMGGPNAGDDPKNPDDPQTPPGADGEGGPTDDDPAAKGFHWWDKWAA